MEEHWGMAGVSGWGPGGAAGLQGGGALSLARGAPGPSTILQPQAHFMAKQVIRPPQLMPVADL